MTSIRPNGQVEFRFFRPNALKVKVLGTFNKWAGDSLVMSSQGDGWWTAYAELDAGEYRFRYQADGQWYTDFAAYGVESGKYGWNSVLVIPESTGMNSMTLAGKIPADFTATGDNKGRFVQKTRAKLAA